MSELESETELDEPIKVRWTGYGRNRISEYNGDFSTEKSDQFCRTVNRQKTNVVIKTVEEAEAVASELNSFIGETGQRVWMNGPMDKAFSRVQREIIEGMEERGYEVQDRFMASLSFEKED